MVQVIYPPQGLLPYPNAGIGEQTADAVKSVIEAFKSKEQFEKDKEMMKLDIYLKTGEITGEFEKATPDIQKAFKKVYGMEPPTIFKEGGKTMEGKKSAAEIDKTKAETGKQTAMQDWYNRRKNADGNVNVKALDYAVKYANSKLGKPFEVMSDEERGMWQTYHDEGLQEFYKSTGVNSTGTSIKSYTPDQQGFINTIKSLPKTELNKLATNKDLQKKFDSKLKTLGLTREDVF